MNKKTRRFLIVGIVIVLIIGLLGGGFCAYKLYKHEKKQQAEISSLMGDVEYLEEKLIQATEYYDFQNEYADDTYNYLAIGNSLTLITSWERGICSTEPDNDYFNLVVDSLEQNYGKVVAYPINYSPWERLDSRDKAFDLLNPYLDEKLNLVTIQLGENVSDTSTYEADLESLINHIKEVAPNATILVIGDWWSLDKNEMRKTAAANTDVLFADLSEIVGNTDYQSVTGTECKLANGSTVTVSEVAHTHPGDLGMQYIADKVIETLGIKK